MARPTDTRPVAPRNRGRPGQILSLVVALTVFFLSLELLGASFRLLGQDVASALIRTTSNPFVGLFVGVLATAMIQSSSTVTSMVVSVVAAGGLTVSGAIPIVMGSNVGTSLTNTLVSLGHVTRRDEFRLATSGAAVHDFFNLLTVAVLLPLEIMFGVLSGPAEWLASGVSEVGGTRILSPLNFFIQPMAEQTIEWLGSNGWLVLAVGVSVLFGSIRYLVRILRVMTVGASERAIHRYLLADPPRALLVGVVLTVMVQSSSITTSLVVPLAAAGVYSVAQIFPFVIGANIGTTITALLAALAIASGGSNTGTAALQVAFAHVLFNLFGAAIFFPVERVRRVPVMLATALGRLAGRNRAFAIAYIVTVFFLVPLLVIAFTRTDRRPHTPAPPQTVETTRPGATVAD